MPRNLNNMFREILNQINDAVFIINVHDTTFLEVNDQACDILGYTRDELLKLSVFKIDPVVNSQEQWQEILKTLNEQKWIRHETVHRRKDGTTFPVEVSTKIVHQADQKFLCSVTRDLTTCKATENELAALKKEVNRLNRELDRAEPYSL